MSPCRPGGPAWPSAPASPWATGERWDEDTQGARDGLAVHVVASVSGLYLFAWLSPNSPDSTCLTSPPLGPAQAHLLQAALLIYSFLPLSSVLPGPPQFLVNTHVSSLLRPLTMDPHQLPAVGGRSFWSLEHLLTSPGPAWEAEVSEKGLSMWGGGPRRPRTGGAGRDRSLCGRFRVQAMGLSDYPKTWQPLVLDSATSEPFESMAPTSNCPR